MEKPRVPFIGPAAAGYEWCMGGYLAAQWSSITPVVSVRGEEAGRRRIDGVAPTWDRRGWW
jgi:hypothetical protein